MTPALSLYFDVVRFGAAVAVMLYHLWPTVFPKFPLPWPGHEAVVIFFVLSGYVISYTSARPGESLKKYAMHRSVRILSVSIPAVLLTIAIAPFVSHIALPSGGDLSQSWSEFAIRIVTNLFFIAEYGLWQYKLPFNIPYWSINYEVTYYLIFGILFFITSKKAKLLCFLFCVILVGFKILVMFPIWLFGVAVHRLDIKLSERTAIILFCVTVLAGLLFYFFEISKIIRSLGSQIFPLFWANLSNANQFIGDWILGLIVAINFIAVSSLPNLSKIFSPAEKLIRLLSSYTLSIYLYHMPLAALLWIGLGVNNPFYFFIILITIVVILGNFTERRVNIYRSSLSKFLKIY